MAETDMRPFPSDHMESSSTAYVIVTYFILFGTKVYDLIKFKGHVKQAETVRL